MIFHVIKQIPVKYAGACEAGRGSLNSCQSFWPGYRYTFSAGTTFSHGINIYTVCVYMFVDKKFFLISTLAINSHFQTFVVAGFHIGYFVR